MEDYRSALNHTFLSAPNLQEFSKRYEIPMPGDRPTWFYMKKIVAQLPPTSTINQTYLSLIPEQGPFHVKLNINEDIVQNYHTIFAKIYDAVFGSEFPEKPKPF